MGYAVLHLEKGTNSLSGLGNHIERIPGKEYSYKNADPKRLKLNKNFKTNKYAKMGIVNAVNSRISDGYKSKRAVRKDSVRFCKAMLTGSHEDMIRISKDPKKLNEWIQANYDFAAEQWGAENIVRFVLHLDERTPHLHCVFVPLTEDGRLSAKEVIGNKKKLEALQDNYAIRMKQFNLKRGLRGSKAKHETVQEYYGRVDRAVAPVNNNEAFSKLDEAIEKPSKLDFLNIEKYTLKTKESAKSALKDVLKRKDKALVSVENENRELKKELGKVKGHLYKLNRDIGDLNQASFKMKVSKNHVVFVSEGFKAPVEIKAIEKNLNRQKFESGIESIPKKLFRDVLNVHYQNALKKYDLLKLSPDNIEDLADLIIDGLNGYHDQFDYTVNQDKVHLEFNISQDAQDLKFQMRYENPYREEGSPEVSTLTYNRSSEKREITESLFNAQKQLINQKRKGKSKGI